MPSISHTEKPTCIYEYILYIYTISLHIYPILYIYIYIFIYMPSISRTEKKAKLWVL